jgi:hypothetical protein
MSAPTTEPPLSADQRETLAGLADQLVPASEGMPAASEVKVPEKWVDRVLAARPDLAPALVAVLDQAAGKDPAAEVKRLGTEEPDAFGILAVSVTAAYYMHPRVRKLYGYPGQKENPALPDESDYYLRDGILDPVIARGPIYRTVPVTT